ncbi:MAG: transcriptional regulator [Deltaproteobacteria bacterium]|nr:transcriptional regulator [Deltaproteobacteria bacterium]
MSSLVERAKVAAADGDWEQAYDLLAEADPARLNRADLSLLAGVAYAAGHFDVTIETWERVFAEASAAGEPLAAADAAVHVAMHLLFDTAFMAPVRGWLARADRLLASCDPSAVHAWFAAVRAYERLLSGDLATARQQADRAIGLGATHDRAAAAIGHVASARCLLLAGDVRAGLAMLDEAGVAMLSGELDPLSTGVVYCEVVCALQALAQYDLAEQWTQAMERWARTNAIGSLHGRCRVHRAEILRLRGDCDAAEHEASAACEELRPYLRRELGWPLTELGRIRLQRGDVAGAEQAFREAHECGWDAQPGLALVHLAKQEVELAIGSIRYALAHPSSVPSKEQPPNTQLRRAPLLEAHVGISLAAGQLDEARLATEELERIAARFESKALLAAAAGARGKLCLASDDAGGARGSFGRAAELWNEVGAPYEMALVRLGLADAHRAEGNAPLADLELRSARSMLARQGSPARVTDAPEPVATTAVFRREGETWRITFAGQTARLADLKGLHYLARLLGEPGRAFAVLELVALERGDAASTNVTGDAGPVLDARAKQVYRRRLAEIEEDLEEATARHDLGRVEQAQTERELLVRELSRAVGLGGRDRLASNTAERARASVTRAIRQAIERIREQHPSLAEHLDRAVRTGGQCSYVPEAGAIRWQV